MTDEIFYPCWNWDWVPLHRGLTLKGKLWSTLPTVMVAQIKAENMKQISATVISRWNIPYWNFILDLAYVIGEKFPTYSSLWSHELMHGFATTCWNLAHAVHWIWGIVQSLIHGTSRTWMTTLPRISQQFQAVNYCSEVAFVSQKAQAVLQALQQTEGGTNHVLRVVIENMIYPVTLDVLNTIFSKFGVVLKIITFTKNSK